MRGGKGPPLLYLHGANGASAWLPFMEQLAQRFDVIVPEHPGFGGSDMPDWLDNVGDLAYFYLDMIDELGLDDVHLVGSSLGGWIAAELAVRSSARLKTLVLSAPAGIHVKGVSKGDIFLWSPEKSARNLFHDQTLADAALAQPLGEAEQMADDEKSPRHGQARLAAAALQSASRQVAASYQAADADPVGRRRQGHSAGLWSGLREAHPGRAARGHQGQRPRPADRAGRSMGRQDHAFIEETGP